MLLCHFVDNPLFFACLGVPLLLCDFVCLLQLCEVVLATFDGLFVCLFGGAGFYVCFGGANFLVNNFGPYKGPFSDLSNSQTINMKKSITFITH